MRRLIILFLILAISSCTEEEVTSRDYPRVDTNEISDITATTAVFRGEIFFSSSEILDHGFIWTDTGFPTLENGNKVSLGLKNGPGLFEITASVNFQAGKMYSVRAYAQSANYKVYGKTIQIEMP
jgi:hypothetical protein